MQSRKNPDEAESGRSFRPDIEGLRAVAIVAVLLCHAGVPFLAGGYVGVDVFFVISGFLITKLLLGELDRSGTISLRGFYARRAKRLLPLSAILLATVGVLSLIFLSPLRNTEVAGDITSAALYVANWHFAAQSINYFDQGLEPSPVLHLWSLAIEEQFYLVWPGLMLAVTWFWRRRGKSVRPVLWVALALILAGSLIYGVILTNEKPAFAYFDTFARAWELGLGAALALAGTVKLPRPQRGRARLDRHRGDRLRQLRLHRRNDLPGDGGADPDPRRRGADPLRHGAGRDRGRRDRVQGGRGLDPLPAADPLRRPHLILLVPLALALPRLRRGDLGPAPLGRRRPRRGRRLLGADPAHPHPGRGPGAPRAGAETAADPGDRARPRLHADRRGRGARPARCAAVDHHGEGLRRPRR